MNSSYKVALAAAAAIFVVVVVYWAYSGSGGSEDDAPPAMAIDPGGLPEDELPATAPRDSDSLRREIESRSPEADATGTEEPAAGRDAPAAVGDANKPDPKRSVRDVAGLITGDDTPDDGPAGGAAPVGAIARANVGTGDDGSLGAGSNTAVDLGPPGELTLGGEDDTADDTAPTARRPAEPAPPVRAIADRRVEPDPVGRAAEPARTVRREPTVAASPAQPRVYIIREGDTFSSIAEREFGDARHYIAIENENPTVNASRLKIGQEIRLPAEVDLRDFGRREGPAAARAAAPPAGAEVYVVQPGDSLRRIAREHYGSEAQWELIYQANRELIGPDPAKIDLDMRLVLPPAE